MKGERNGNERGFSLIEMLVATAIFAIAAAVAFILYSAAQKSYKTGENLTDQQQSTRVAFDRMLSDLRLAGFNSNPDGDSTRIDEQIEGAWDTAVTFRGDFDFEDPTAAATPESALAGTAYNIVSTGNDEIVTYVLAKSGATGPNSLTLVLDPDRPRAKATKTVTIPNIALVQNNPPYTLYRVTLANLSGTFPTSPQAASNYVYEPVADNIRSLTFRYYDDGGVLLSPNTPANSADDIGGGAGTAEITRSRIRRIEVNLEGMTRDPDRRYNDPGDVSATTNYRKFRLDSDISPENLGKSGVRDIDVTPPPAPTNVTVVPGHCKGVLVKWDQPASTDGVTAYSVKSYPSGSPSAFAVRGFTYPHVEYGTIDYDGHAFYDGLTAPGTYCFQVQAKDSAGNQSGWSPVSSPPCATLSNTTTPGTPQGVVATGNGTIAPLDTQITVTWDQLQVNTGTVTNDPDLISGATILRDAKGHKVYRADDAAFTVNLQQLPDASTIQPVGSVSYTDTGVVNCKNYYYKVSGVDTCDPAAGSEGPKSTAALGRAVTTVKPSKPTGVLGAQQDKFSNRISWPPVTTNVNSVTMFVGTYKVYRAMAATGTPAGSISLASYVVRGTVNPVNPPPNPIVFLDNLDATDRNNIRNGQSFFYRVSASDLCPNESDLSDPVEVSCSFSGSLSPNPANNASNGGTISLRLTVTGSSSYAAGRVRITRQSDAVVVQDRIWTSPTTPPTPGSVVMDFGTWNTAADGGGNYTIYWEAENDKGCISTLTNTFTVVANLACQITPTNPNLTPTTGNPSNQYKTMSWDIVNNSGVDLFITSIQTTWTSVICASPCVRKLTQIQYPIGTVPFGNGNIGTGLTSPATATYAFPLTLPATANGSCSSCKRDMSMTWDYQLRTTGSPASGETVTVRYNFQDAGGVTGYCQFDIKPDLTVVLP